MVRFHWIGFGVTALTPFTQAVLVARGARLIVFSGFYIAVLILS